MISIEDCLAFCGLTEDEVLAIAEHEHIPEVTAAALAQYLLSQPHGAEKIRDMIIDDLRKARSCNDSNRVREFALVLRHFLEAHPEVSAEQTYREFSSPKFTEMA